MAPIARVERLVVKARAGDRRAEHDRVQPSGLHRRVRTEGLVTIPETEVALDAECFVPLASPRRENLHLWMWTIRGADLHTAPAVVMAEAPARADGREARFEG